MKTKILKRALLLVAILLACTVQSLAEDFEYNGLIYTILTDNTCQTKSGTYYSSDNVDAGNSVSGDLVIPETVYDEDGKEYTVTKIGNYAFYSCSDLTSVSIPNTVTKIGYGAFSGCSGLTEVSIPNSVNSTGDYSFYMCTGLISVSIPNSVTTIGNASFYKCSSLTSATIPESVTKIGDFAFYGCSNLTEANIPDLVASIGKATFYGCTGLTEITIPNSVITIGDYAFDRCSGITKITIPNSVTSIGEYAFYGCSALISVNIPESVTSISSYVLYGCSSLTEVTIPSSVTSIGDFAFRGCSGLTEVTIPSSVASIGKAAFCDCSGLKEITIPNSVTSTGIQVFFGCSGLTSVTISNALTEISEGMFCRCSGLSEITIPESVTSIGSSAFEYCSGLKEITIPNSVSSLSFGIFYGCTGLTSISIPNSVTSIDTQAFSDCISLTSLTIPNSVTSIGRAFSGCSGITTLKFEDGDGELTVSTSAFSSVVTPTDVYFGRQMDFTVVPRTKLETVSFGKNVSSIAAGTFKDGTAIRTVYSFNPTPPTADDIFSNETYLEGALYVPKASIEAYQAADGWKNFVTVSSKVSAIEIDKTSASLHETETVTITANITPSFASNQSVIWSVSDESVAKISVDETTHICTVIAVATGTCDIVAKSAENVELTASCTITVRKTTYPESIELSEYSVTLKEGNSHTINSTVSPSDVDVKTVTWSSSDEQVATVSETGIITGISKGSCDVTATTANGLQAVCHVSVIEDTEQVLYEGIVYILYKTKHIATVTYAESGSKYSGNITIPSFLEQDDTEYTVTEIEREAFSGCSDLTSVVIPNSVTEIGGKAFYGCTGLKWIESQSVTPPTIQPDTFSDYSVPLIAASDDYKTADNWSIFTAIFTTTSYTPTSTTFEVDGLKYEIISISDLSCRLYAIDESVTGENVVIPESVVYKNHAFAPIEIKGVLLNGESSVKSLSIPSCASSISNGMVLRSSLDKLIVNASTTTNPVVLSSLGELVISSTVNGFSADLSSNSISKITISDGNTELNIAQLNCSDTKKVYLGRNVSASTFKGMASLAKVTISDKVTSISKSAFADCIGLTEFTIPSSVTTIGSSAFNGCINLRTVVSRNTTPPTINDADATFCNDTYLDGVLYVPNESIASYQASYGWKNFSEIKPLDNSSNVADIVADDEAITVDNGAIIVNSDSQVRIVALNGSTIYNGRGDDRVNVAPGVYVVIVGNTAHKVAVR